ncbi:hypothetical protein AO703_15830 [[Enterobacter] lignolyticus]|uniref:Uncharacterized protein n=1 Tax=[Enterobacter] lignolyticus TaxID=1334193 RepID=A0A806X743_9ENTR|nr:hypothetical protein AO703_15830 [[Enterobacter] lignolyticus]
MRNQRLAIFNGFLFRFVMQIIHVATNIMQSDKEPFTTQGYFHKMHLKYIIMITLEGSCYA